MESTLVLSRRDIKRLKIVRSANELAKCDSLAKPDVSSICARSGISKPTYYRYFARKDSMAAWLLRFVTNQSLHLGSVGSKEFWNCYLSQCLEFKFFLMAWDDVADHPTLGEMIAQSLYDALRKRSGSASQCATDCLPLLALGFSSALSLCLVSWIKRGMAVPKDDLILDIMEVVPAVFLESTKEEQ